MCNTVNPVWETLNQRTHSETRGTVKQHNILEKAVTLTHTWYDPSHILYIWWWFDVVLVYADKVSSTTTQRGSSLFDAVTDPKVDLVLCPLECFLILWVFFFKAHPPVTVCVDV